MATPAWRASASRRWARRAVQPFVEPLVVLGEGVDQALIHAQRAARVAQGAAGAVADHRGGQRGALAPVLAVDVLDDLLAPLVLEVDVDVGRLVLALAADEALQQRAGMARVGLGDPQAIAHHRVGGRTPALAQDALVAGEAHDVVHGEEEHLVAAFGDQRQLLVDEALDARRHALGVAPGRALAGEPRQGLGGREAGQHGLLRVVVAHFVQHEGAARGHGEGGIEQVGRVAARQPVARAQVALGVGLQREAAFVHGPAHADGGHHVVQALGGAHVHAHVAGRHQRATGGGGSLPHPRQPEVVVGRAVQLQQQVDFQANEAADPRQLYAISYQIGSILAVTPWRPQQLAAGQRAQGIDGRVEAVGALGRGAAGLGDELAQVAPAAQVARQGDQRALPAEAELASEQQAQRPRARVGGSCRQSPSAFQARTAPATEHSSVMASAS